MSVMSVLLLLLLLLLYKYKQVSWAVELGQAPEGGSQMWMTPAHSDMLSCNWSPSLGVLCVSTGANAKEPLRQ